MAKEEFPEFIEELATEVEGDQTDKDILTFTLSTCQWCKKCKRYLNESGVKYRYVDIDKLSGHKKAKILNYLAERFKKRVSYPFLVCDGEAVVGFRPEEYDRLLKGGD